MISGAHSLNKILFCAFLTICTTPLTSFAKSNCDSHRMAPRAVSADQLKNAESFLWEVTAPGGGRSYLMGVTHGVPRREVEYWDVLRLLVREARVYMPEIPLDVSSLNGFGSLAPGTKPIYKSLDLSYRARLEAALGKNGQNSDTVKSMKTWALYSAIGQYVTRDFIGLDQILYSTAANIKIPIQNLESIAELERHFDVGFQPAFHMDVLKDVLCNIDAVRDQAVEVVRSFTARDPKSLVTSAMKLESVGNSRSQDFNRKLLQDRNRIFVAKLIPELRRGGVVSVFGALHLFGNGGVIEELRKAGFTLEPISVDAARQHLSVSSTDAKFELPENIRIFGANDSDQSSGVPDIIALDISSGHFSRALTDIKKELLGAANRESFSIDIYFEKFDFESSFLEINEYRKHDLYLGLIGWPKSLFENAKKSFYGWTYHPRSTAGRGVIQLAPQAFANELTINPTSGIKELRTGSGYAALAHELTHVLLYKTHPELDEKYHHCMFFTESGYLDRVLEKFVTHGLMYEGTRAVTLHQHRRFYQTSECEDLPPLKPAAK